MGLRRGFKRVKYFALSGLMQRAKNILKTFFLNVIDQRLFFEAFSSSNASLLSLQASGLLQYLGINIPLWLNQLFENEFLGTAVIIKDRHAEVNGNLCVS